MARPALPAAERQARRAASLARAEAKRQTKDKAASAARRLERGLPQRATQWDRAEFIGVDGEGITDAKGRHRYVLLCASTGEVLKRATGLSSRACLEWLCALRDAHPRAILAGFGLSYDVNMILADLPRRAIRRVWAGERVTWHGFGIESRHRKTFRVWREPRKWIKQANGNYVNATPAALWWDTFGFFQGSFVEAIRKYLGADHPDVQFIYEQKQRRRDFKAADLPTMERYCLQECRVLVELLHRLRTYLGECDLRITRWDGAGAVAASLFQRYGIKQHLSRANPIEMPRAVLTASQHAYAGGRMEVLRYGHAPRTPIYHYDINSAYPHAFRSLPSLAHGRWEQETQSDLYHWQVAGFRHELTPPFGVYHVRWKFHRRANLYPFFWRAPHGSIFFPPEGEGWYWTPEVVAAVDALNDGQLNGDLEILDGWRFTPFLGDVGLKPFAWIPELYEQRREWKRLGLGAEKVLKLGLNSLYGKTAQHLGGTSTAPPTYHELAWAGWTTSATRAELFRRAVGHPGIIMLATDALYSLTPLDLPTGEGLGQWSATTHSGLTVVQSGLYWTDDADGSTALFCRGWDKDKKSLSREKIVKAWSKGQKQLTAQLTRFMGMGSALAGGDAWGLWRTWRTVPRVLALTLAGTKRIEATRQNPALGLVRTVATEYEGRYFEPMSAPYPLPWERPAFGLVDGVQEEEVLREAQDIVTD